MTKNYIYTAAAAMLLTLCSCGNMTKKTEGGTDTVACKTICIYSEEMDNKWYYVGEVKAGTSTGVSFSVPGLVRKVHCNVGDKVVQGQLLAELDPSDLKNSYDIAAASYERALDAQRRLKIMHDEQSVADIKYVEVETKVEQARASYTAAKKRLDDTKLYAPVSGVIGKRNIDVGENIALGLSAFTILDVNKVTVNINVPEREISHIALGDRALIKVIALDDDVSYKASVSSIGVMSDPMTHSYTVGFDIDNRGGKLREGMVCNVQIWPESRRGEKGFVIPVSCINVNTQSQHYVWIVRNGKASRQVVTVESYSNEGIYVTAGLRDGDRIVTEGLERLSEGATVKVISNTDTNIKSIFE